MNKIINYINGTLTFFHYALLGWGLSVLWVWIFVGIFVHNPNMQDGGANLIVEFSIGAGLYIALQTIRFILKRRFGMGYEVDSYDPLDFYNLDIMKNKKIQTNAEELYNNIKNLPKVEFNDENELSKLFINACKTINEHPNVTIQKELIKYGLSYDEIKELSFFHEKSIGHIYNDDREYGFGIIFNDKPPLIISYMSTSVDYKVERTMFNQRYVQSMKDVKRIFLKHIEKLNYVWKESNASEYAKNFKIREYFICYGTIKYSISKTKYDQLTKIYKEALVKNERFKLNNHIANIK